MKASIKGYICAILSGACFGIIPLLVLGVSRNQFAPNSFCVMARMFFAAVLLLPTIVVRLKKTPLPPALLKRMVLSAVLLSATSILLYTSYQYLPSGIGITLHYLYPLVVMVLSVLLFRMRVSPKTVMAMLLSLLGIVFLCDVAVLPANAVIGIILAVLSSVTFAAYLIWNEKSGLSGFDPIVFVTVISLLNTVIIFLYNLFTDQLYVTLSAKVFLFLFAAGIFEICAVLTQILAIKYVGSVYTSILGTLEPIICTIGSALLLHDIISLRTALGSALVLVAVVIVTISGNQKEATKNRSDM